MKIPRQLARTVFSSVILRLGFIFAEESSVALRVAFYIGWILRYAEDDTPLVIPTGAQRATESSVFLGLSLTILDTDFASIASRIACLTHFVAMTKLNVSAFICVHLRLKQHFRVTITLC